MRQAAREADARMGCMGWYRHPHRDSSSARDAVNRTQPAIPPAGNHRRRPDQPGPAVGRIRRPYGGGDLVSRRLLRRPPTIAQLPPAIMMPTCKRCRGMCAGTTRLSRHLRRHDSDQSRAGSQTLNREAPLPNRGRRRGDPADAHVVTAGRPALAGLASNHPTASAAARRHSPCTWRPTGPSSLMSQATK